MMKTGCDGGDVYGARRRTCLAIRIVAPCYYRSVGAQRQAVGATHRNGGHVAEVRRGRDIDPLCAIPNVAFAPGDDDFRRWRRRDDSEEGWIAQPAVELIGDED